MSRSALVAAAVLLLASQAVAAEPVCYWGGLLRDCKTGCIESRTTDRCSGLTLKHPKRHK